MMKRKFRKVFLLTIIVTCFSRVGLSQDYSGLGHNVDSLKRALVGSTGQNKYNILDQLAYEYVTVVDSIALLYAIDAFKMSWHFGDSVRIVKSGRIKAMALNGLEEYDSTIMLSGILLPIARRHSLTTEIKRLLNLLGIAHTHKAEYDKALTYHFESLELRKRHEDNLSISIVLNNIGVVYYKIENYVQALEYFEKSLAVETLNGDPLPNVSIDRYVINLANISLCHSYLNNLAKANEYIKKARKLCTEDCAELDKVMLNFASGVLHFTDGNMVKASAMFLESLSLARKILDRRYELDNLAYLAEISMRSNQLMDAEKYLLQAQPLFESGIPFKAELVQVYEQLSKVYVKSRNYQKASLFQARFIELKEKVYSKQLTINLMKVQAEYLERENKAKIESQAKILALNIDVISKQRTLNIIIGVVAVLSIALAITLIQNVRQKNRVNTLLEQKVRERTIELETNHTESLKALEVRNQQMKRISSEVNSSMATIKGLCRLSNQDASVVNAGQYISKIEAASDRLKSGILRTLGIGENVAS